MRQSQILHPALLPLFRVVFAGRCQPLLEEGPSRRYLCESFLGCLDLYLAGLRKCTCPFLPPATSAFPAWDMGRLSQKKPAQRLLSGPVFRDGSHSIMFRPPSLLATQVAPTVAVLCPQGSRGVYIRAERMSFPSCVSDMLVVRIGQLTTGDLHPIRLAALSAAPPRLRDRPLRACHGRTPRRIPSPPCPKKNVQEMVVAFR